MAVEDKVAEIGIGTYLHSEDRLVQVLEVKDHPKNDNLAKYICEDVRVSTDVAAPIVEISKRQVKAEIWKVVEHGKETT